MEPENLNTEEQEVVEEKNTSSNLNKVTSLSKCLTMVLFIVLPFIGGWIGYQYAPEKVVEVERVVVVVKEGDSTEEESLKNKQDHEANSPVFSEKKDYPYFEIIEGEDHNTITFWEHEHFESFGFSIPSNFSIEVSGGVVKLFLDEGVGQIVISLGPKYITPYCTEEVEMFDAGIMDSWNSYKFIGNGESGCTHDGVDLASEDRQVYIITDIVDSNKIQAYQIYASYPPEEELLFERVIKELVESYSPGFII